MERAGSLLGKAYGQIFQLFSANLVKAFFGFLGTILVLRGWSTADIADIYTLVGVMLLFQQFGDLGTGSSFIQIMSRSPRENQAVIDPFLGFKVLVVSILFLFFVSVCGIYIFISPSQEIYGLAMVCLAAIFGVYGGFFAVLTTARQNFTDLSYLKIFPPLIKTAFIFILYYLQLTNFNWLLLAFIVPSVALFILGYRFTRYPFYEGNLQSIFSKRGRQLYEMSRWVFLLGFGQTWFSQLDIFMLKRMSSDYQIAQFVSAQKLAAVVLMFSQAIFTVMLPKMRSFKTNEELKILCKKLFILYFICVGLMIPLTYLAPIVVPFLLGVKYIDSIPILKVFLFQAIGFMFISSQSLVFYRKNKLPTLVFLTFLQLGANFLGNYWVIYEYKALGAVWVSTILNNFFYFIALGYSLFLLRKPTAILK